MEQGSTPGVGQRLKWLVALGTIVAAGWFFYSIRGMLAPFLLAFVLSYILAPLVDRLEGRGLNRTVGVLLLFVFIFGGLGFGLVGLGDALKREVDDLLVREVVTDSLMVINTAEKVQMIRAEWVNKDNNRPFKIGSSDSLVIKPGETGNINIRFAPLDTNAVEAVLKLSSTDRAEPFYLSLKGNAPSRLSPRKNKQRIGSPAVLDSLVYMRREIDFGRAGPRLGQQMTVQLSNQLNKVYRVVQPLFGGDLDLELFVQNRAQGLITPLLGKTTDVLGGILSGISYIALVPLISFFFLREGNRIAHAIVELVPNPYFELSLNLLHHINAQIGGYIRGQILATSIVACLAVIGLTMVGLRFPLVVGVVAGLANMIPYLGPLIGLGAALIVSLATSGGWNMVVQVAIVFLFVQLIDNILVQPTVVAKSVDLHPLVVIIAVMVGSQIWGIIGMLIAVPLTGILKVSCQTVYASLQTYRHRDFFH